MSLYDRLAATPEGARGLAAARAKREALKALSQAIRTAGGYAELSEASGVPVDRITDAIGGSGSIKIGRLARMLHGAGFELELTLVPAGQPRREVLERRAEVMAAKTAERPVPWTDEDGNVWDAEAYTDRNGRKWEFWRNHSAHADLPLDPWYSTRGDAPAAIQYLVLHLGPLTATEKGLT